MCSACALLELDAAPVADDLALAAPPAAHKYDCRRLIQGAQALSMFVSAMWGVLFLADTLTIPAACVLLVLHGGAGAMWGPAEQLMLHDFVEPHELPSAVRLNATFRSLGILFGPVVGRSARRRGRHPRLARCERRPALRRYGRGGVVRARVPDAHAACSLNLTSSRLAVTVVR
jgi:hypothetical protein